MNTEDKNTKQKLCYIMPDYRPDDATHFSHIHDFLKYLARDFDLTVISMKGTVPVISPEIKRTYLIRLPFPLRLAELKWRLFVERLRGCRDFYIHYSFEAAFIAALSVGILGGRVFYWNCGEPWKYRRSVIRDFFERIVYRLVDRLVTGGSSLADRYAKEYRISRDKISVMPNWIDLSRFTVVASKQKSRGKLGLPENAKIVLFVHRLSPRKGSRVLIPVALELTRIFHDLIFVVVGSGPDESFLKEEIKKNKIEDRMIMKGSLPNNLVKEYINAANVFFMPSDEEGFPRVLLEAMSLGVPYVGSDVGVVKEITPEALKKYISPAGMADKFVLSLKEALEKNSDEIDRMSESERLEVSKYDINKILPTFRSILERKK